MTQVFNNIFLNSVQASIECSDAVVTVHAERIGPDEKYTLTGQTEAFPDQPVICIVITDKGPGFDPKILYRVFATVFPHVSEWDRPGLTSSFLIVGNHNGGISASNGENGGAEITVLIPGARESSSSNAKSSGPREHRYRVLLLDDEDLVRESISMLLKDPGHEVVEARDGDEALARIHEETNNNRTCPVALLDLTMRKGRGGADIAEELKLPGIICVVVSGDSDRPAMAHPQNFGFHAVLSQPFRGTNSGNSLLPCQLVFRDSVRRSRLLRHRIVAWDQVKNVTRGVRHLRRP